MSKIIIETELKELPENCYDCPFSINGICQADNKKRTSQEYRPFWCPNFKRTAIADILCIKGDKK